MLYSTGPGHINFYKDNTQINPLVVIDFNSGFVSPYGFGANEVLFTAANVRITGSEITGTLSQEQFSFSFANTAPLPEGHNGFTATAAFTSSAVPEPATVCLLGLGALSLAGRKKRLQLKKTKTINKHCLILILLTFLSVGFISVNAKAASSFTVATFADPSGNSNNPLFTADFTALTLDGGWADSKTGLTLQIPYNGHTFANAWFDVNGVVTLSSVIPNAFYNTGPGKINFYADNNTNPLIVIDFNSGFVSPYGFGANEVLFTAANVRITGSEITGTLSQEQFSFSCFANTAPLPGCHNGFTATAAFTSSAVPEPATIALLTLGGLVLFKRKST
jgi:hypothetical protein